MTKGGKVWQKRESRSTGERGERRKDRGERRGESKAGNVEKSGKENLKHGRRGY